MASITRERLESLSETGEIFDAASLKDVVNLEAKVVDGKTPLEYCLGVFDQLAVGDDADECVCGGYEMHLNVIALLEAGAVQTKSAKKILKEIERIATSIATGNHYYQQLGAEREVNAVLACAKKMSSAKAAPKSKPAAKRAAPDGASPGTEKTKKTAAKVAKDDGKNA